MISIPTIQTSGNPPEGDPNELSPAQRMEWNKYVDWIASKGYKGSPLLDRKESGLAKSLFDEYTKLNPATPLKYDDIKAVQMEMQKMKDAAQGFAARKGDPNAKNIMSGVSQIDGWPGSKTTSFKFPDMDLKQIHNGAMVMNKNLGLVNSRLEPVGAGGGSIGMMKRGGVPKGVQLEDYTDSAGNKQKGYTDPKTGDVVIVNQ